MTGVHLSAKPPTPPLLHGAPVMPDHVFAWFAACCHLMAKSPLFMVVLMDHREAGEFCWLCAMNEGCTPLDAVRSYQQYTERKRPEDTSKSYYALNVQVATARA